MTMACSYHLHERLVFMLRFIKAQFPNSQKHYDYICDLDDIQKGEVVFVMTQYGKKLVTVRGIFYSELEDMPLPGYAYKRILEKFVPDPPPNDNEPDDEELEDDEEEAEDYDDSEDEEAEGDGNDDVDDEEAEGDDNRDDDDPEGDGNDDGDEEEAGGGNHGEREQETQTVRASRPEDNKLAEERRRLQHDESGLRIVLLLLPAVVFIYLLYRFVFA